MNNSKRTLAVASAIVVGGTLLTAAPSAVTAAEAAPVAVPSATKIKKSTAKKRKQARLRVVRVAKSKVGKRYVTGGTGPWAFDCSGLMWHSYRKAHRKTLPRTAAAQNWGTKNISRRNLKPGDLVFFYGNGHVAMYIGKGKIVHALNPRAGVKIDRLSGYWSSQMNGAGRVIVKR